MGSAPEQSQMCGAQARTWGDSMDGMCLPVYHVVLDQTNVGRETRLLDIGCGTGMAAQLAAMRGARVWGLDASEAELVIARERVADGDFTRGEMEDLPYADGVFDVVTAFNSMQFADNPRRALWEAGRVTVRGGYVGLVTWGRMSDCEMAVTVRAVMACLPPTSSESEGTFSLAESGKLEALAKEVGLTVRARGDVSCPFVYADDETAWRTISSSGPLVRAIRAADEERLKMAVMDSLAPFRTASGGYRQENLVHYVLATV